MERRQKTQQDVINWTGAIIAVMLMSIIAFVVYALVRWSIPDANENPLMFILGQLSGMATVIVTFHFGGSIVNKKQAETIDTLAKTAQTAGAALPAATPAVIVPPGGTATIEGTEAGATITTDPPKP